MESDTEKYMGHGFQYMNGFSTTDFTGYHVYDGEKLNLLDHPVDFVIEDERDMPVLDGAEACYPLYNAIAKTVYKDIGEIEKNILDEIEKKINAETADSRDYSIYYSNGKYVTFTNTVNAYEGLIGGKVDLVFAARPSENQRELAAMAHEQIETIPIGKEAFVFFVEEDNPVDSLTIDEIRAIYHGDITNWKEVGGKDEKIVAFQRPEDSGSQVIMKYFMGDVSLKEPMTFEYMSGMGDVVEKVAEYNNEAGAIGYTFRYFLTGLSQETHVKMIAVDGIEPSIANIHNGTYPITADLVLAKLVSNEKENVLKMVDFILSDDGQKLVELNGYSPLTDRNVSFTIENEMSEPSEIYSGEDDFGQWQLYLYGKMKDFYRCTFELYHNGQMIKGMMDLCKDDGNNDYYVAYNQKETCSFILKAEDDTLVLSEYLTNEENLLLPQEGIVFHRQ